MIRKGHNRSKMDKILGFFAGDLEQVHNPKDLIRYYSVGFLIIIASLIHIFLCSYFLYFKIMFFVYYNLTALIFSSFMFLLNRKGHCELSVMIMTFEIILCSILLTATFGWDSSFQWYIVLALMPYYLFLESSLTHKIIISTVALLSIYFIFYISQINPLWISKENVNINLLMFINLNGLVFICFSEIKMNEMIKEYVRVAHEKYIKSLENAAQKDPLTNLWNRRYADLYFEREITQGKGFCVALIDVDHFKKINDKYGHDVGDEILIQFSELLEQTFRSSDAIIRWGGEEIMICLKQVSIDSAYKLLEKLRKTNEDKIYHILGNDIQFTITIGVAKHEKNKPISYTIRESDECLYYGKNNGRNQVITKQMIK